MNETGEIILSVVIPTKNRPDLLRRAMTSVAMQGYSCFEVCIVDNNNDHIKSNQVKLTVNEFEKKYPNLNWKYIHSRKQSASGARNDGMAATNGKYIFFLDDDDELLNDSIKIRLEEMLADPELSLLYCAAYSLIYPYPFKMYRYYHYNKPLHTKKLMMMSCSSIVINRTIFETNNLFFDENQSRMDDYDLCRKVIKLDLKVKSIPLPLVLIHMHPETRMSSRTLTDDSFKSLLIEKWGQSVAVEIFNYAEGAYIWRKCFGIEDDKFSEIVKFLRAKFNREPTFSFKLKYLLVSVSPVVFLGLYHIAVSVLQIYKNKAAKKLEIDS